MSSPEGNHQPAVESVKIDPEVISGFLRLQNRLRHRMDSQLDDIITKANQEALRAHVDNQPQYETVISELTERRDRIAQVLRPNYKVENRDDLNLLQIEADTIENQIKNTEAYFSLKESVESRNLREEVQDLQDTLSEEILGTVDQDTRHRYERYLNQLAHSTTVINSVMNYSLLTANPHRTEALTRELRSAESLLTEIGELLTAPFRDTDTSEVASIIAEYLRKSTDGGILVENFRTQDTNRESDITYVRDLVRNNEVTRTEQDQERQKKLDTLIRYAIIEHSANEAAARMQEKINQLLNAPDDAPSFRSEERGMSRGEAVADARKWLLGLAASTVAATTINFALRAGGTHIGVPIPEEAASATYGAVAGGTVGLLQSKFSGESKPIDQIEARHNAATRLSVETTPRPTNQRPLSRIMQQLRSTMGRPKYTLDEARSIYATLEQELSKLVQGNRASGAPEQERVVRLTKQIAEARLCLEWERAKQSVPRLKSESTLDHAARVYMRFNELRQTIFQDLTDQVQRFMSAPIPTDRRDQLKNVLTQATVGGLVNLAPIPSQADLVTPSIPYIFNAQHFFASHRAKYLAKAAADSTLSGARGLMRMLRPWKRKRVVTEKNERLKQLNTEKLDIPRYQEIHANEDLFLVSQSTAGLDAKNPLAIKINKAKERQAGTVQQEISERQTAIHRQLCQYHGFFFLSPYDSEGKPDSKVHAYRIWSKHLHDFPKRNFYTPFKAGQSDLKQNRSDLFVSDRNAPINSSALATGQLTVKEYHLDTLTKPFITDENDPRQKDKLKEFQRTWHDDAAPWARIPPPKGKHYIEVPYTVVFAAQSTEIPGDISQVFINPERIGDAVNYVKAHGLQYPMLVELLQDQEQPRT